MMNDFEKIEHLLLSKKFEELSTSEMKEVQEYFENATDYNDMRDTLMQVKSTLAADKLLIKPSVDLKEKLLQQFDKTYPNAGTKTTGKTRPFYKTLAFQWSAAASVVVIITLSAVSYINNMNGMQKSKEMAINNEKPNKDQQPPMEDHSVMSGEVGTSSVVADSTAVVTEKTERKEGFGDDALMGSNSQDADEDKRPVYGNVSTTESTIKESELQNNEDATNAPSYDELNKPVLKDNSTLDTRNNNYIQGEEKRDDANFHYNDVKGKEDSKSIETNTTIPVKSVDNKNRSTDQKAYWTNKKQKNANKDQGIQNQGEIQKQETDDIQLGGYMSVNQMVQTDKKDSLKTSLDSLKMDSNDMINPNLRQRDAKLEGDKDEKDN